MDEEPNTTDVSKDVSDSAPQSIFSGELRPITGAVLMSTALVAFDALSVITILPTVGAELGRIDLLPWVISAFLLASSISVLAAGPAIDTWGAQRIFRVAVATLVVTSAGAGLASSMPVLIAFRLGQGVAGGAAFTVGLATAAIAYPPELRARAYAASSSVWGVASVAAPALAAGLVAASAWRMVFFVNIPLGVVAVALAWRHLPGPVDATQRDRRVDWRGLALIAAFSTAALIGATTFTRWSAVAFAGAGIFAAAYWRYARVADSPVLALRYATERPFAVINMVGFGAIAAVLPVVAFLPLFIEGGMNRSTALASLALTGLSISWAIGAIVSSRLLDRFSETTLVSMGLSMAITGGAMGMILVSDSTAIWVIFVVPVILGLGFGLTTNSLLTALQLAARDEERGRAAASHQYARAFGNAIGPAVGGGLILFAVGRHIGDTGLLQDLLAGDESAISTAARIGIADGFRWAHAVTAGLALMCLVAVRLRPIVDASTR